ncbi:helix-turn-helix domain-containing protein [Nocardia farcinica]|uniref:PucR family transcriptional regulator n=1 Tax=Nocardia farcinica TaxID=37329 RepID=UPI001B3C996B|nr:helix-turn-helix domain-containing protein [Nocardia farcinica]MBF6538146.1 helix-turn-helix domain-containing protein [Nocardia farcinica]
MIGHLSGMPGTGRAPSGSAGAPLSRACHDLAVGILGEENVAAAAARLAAAAASCAREGVALGTVHRIVFDCVHKEFATVEAAHGTGCDGVDRRLWEVLEQAAVAVSVGYLEEAGAVGTQQHSAVDTLTAALLGGRVDPVLIRESGIEVAETYAVVAVSFATAEDEAPRESGRLAQRVRIALAERGRHVLSLLGRDGGTVLVPVSDRTNLERLMAAAAQAAGGPLTATAVTVPRDEIPDAADRAHELLDMVHRLRMGPALYRFEELALEYQITRPGPGLDYLGTVLDPLDEQPKLLETLRCHIGNGLNRQRTARMLNLHTNGLDYRLRRIGRLTGYDPGDARGICYLRAALVARSYREHAG